jgi:hypothetical protein
MKTERQSRLHIPAWLILAASTIVRRSGRPALIKAVARGHAWFVDLVSGRAKSLSEIGSLAKGSPAVTSRGLLDLIAFLPPKLMGVILGGMWTCPRSLQRCRPTACRKHPCKCCSYSTLNPTLASTFNSHCGRVLHLAQAVAWATTNTEIR